MPKRNDVQTLRNICMQCVNKNLSNYFPEDLQCLPWELRQDLIQCSDVVNFDVNRLIGTNVRKLTTYFSNSCKALCNDTFSAVLRTCKSLTHFTCESVGSLTREDFHNFALNIPNIVFLYINSCSFSSADSLNDDFFASLLNDDFLEAVGNNCFKLESLDLVAEITDDGIKRLCQSKSQGRKIKYLGVDGNELTTKAGALTALLNLKQLKILDQRNIVDAFEILFKQVGGCGAQQLPTFQLCKLPSISIDYYPKGFLTFISKICPNSTILDLSVSEPLAGHIGELEKCDRTLKLRISYEFSMSDLTRIASKLTCLSLSEIKVDLESIGFTCLNLTKLNLTGVSCQPLTYVKSGSTSFSKLQKLGISGNASQISIFHLKFLLRNCLDLEKLKISCYNEITDDVMVDVLREVNPLRNLTRFMIRSCRNISKITVMTLLKMENNLQLIKLTGHLGIPRDDICVIESYITENNLLILLDFSPFPFCNCLN